MPHLTLNIYLLYIGAYVDLLTATKLVRERRYPERLPVLHSMNCTIGYYSNCPSYNQKQHLLDNRTAACWTPKSAEINNAQATSSKHCHRHVGPTPPRHKRSIEKLSLGATGQFPSPTSTVFKNLLFKNTRETGCIRKVCVCVFSFCILFRYNHLMEAMRL